ncbi:MAG: Zn-dependent hydrolase [Omnitrophica WOR_2 bacterium SM23_29]|nr:MAG: Zn-dependent hydrolase [Omnitrophica WOR_2 bacterium SM23_29]
MLEGIEWLGHATFKLVKGGKVVYIDPWNIRTKDSADVICITHSHYDHLSVEDIKKLQGKDTIIVATADSVKAISGNIKVVKPGDKIEANSIKIEVVAAYNVNKQFHPKVNGWVGYIITLPDGTRFYHAGDTDYIPEMKDVRADIAAFPVGGTYTMDAQEAAKAANAIRPKILIPMHWGAIVGSRKDAEAFKKRCQGEVVILEQK